MHAHRDRGGEPATSTRLELTVDSVTQTDTACGTPDKPKDSDVGNGNEDDGKNKNDDEGLLPNTGGPALWLLGLGAAALLAGAAFVSASRRENRPVRRH
ncbi:LPXTG cell wall anchor domain-containing protein [Aeromicrobium sp. UC242_57]|uniref:LPXTG cell wall anchor domain-containing protein n=1 Tax=Aeromicrobium sp. UC242_57 TaxID=3374624 RepID=UPI0037A3969D